MARWNLTFQLNNFYNIYKFTNLQKYIKSNSFVDIQRGLFTGAKHIGNDFVRIGNNFSNASKNKVQLNNKVQLRI